MKSCSKIAYESKRQALADAKVIRRNCQHFSRATYRRNTGKKMLAYQCPRCSQWHLTTMKQCKRVKRGA